MPIGLFTLTMPVFSKKTSAKGLLPTNTAIAIQTGIERSRPLCPSKRLALERPAARLLRNKPRFPRPVSTA